MSASAENPTPDNAPLDPGSARLESGMDTTAAVPISDEAALTHGSPPANVDPETTKEATSAAAASQPVGGHSEHALGAPRQRQYEQHELSSLFPRMEAGAFARLVVNILQQGLLEPITIYEGKILDGFHRDEACYAAGKPPIYVELYPALDAFDFVFGKNMERRQMTVSQISIVMARGATHPRGHRARRGLAITGKPEISKITDLETPAKTASDLLRKSPVESGISAEPDPFADTIATTAMQPPEAPADMLTNAQAAKIAGVSPESIVIAKRLIRDGNEHLLNAVMQHGMSNGHALALAKLPVDDQIEAINAFVAGKKEGEKRRTSKAEAQKAVGKSKKENAGIDVTCVVPGESNLSTVLRIINGLDWAISYFKTEVPNEEMQNRYEKILARAKALIANDPNVKKILIVN